jgi:two-component system nitrate/nitrite response regulator NarL
MRDQPIRVLLVDDHRSVLWGLGKLIEAARPQLELAESATCRREALAALDRRCPDIVLLDLDLGGECGIDLVPQLRARAGVQVIILTGLRDRETCDRAVLAGARGMVHKTESAEVVLKAIVRVHAGELWLDRATVGKLFHAPQNPQADRPLDGQHALTPAERRIVAAVVRHKGAPNKVIADALHLSEHTLRNHLASIYSKLDVHNRLDLVLYAMEHGLGVAEAGQHARTRQ